MLDHQNNNTIEKFEGIFTKEDSGVSILINSTINLIKNPETLGLYCYLASKPNDWKINARQLMSHFEVGRDKIYKMINNLMELNLLSRTELRTKGKFTEYHYHLYLRPFQPCPEKPYTDLPDTVNQDTYKTKKNTKQRNNKNINKTRVRDDEKSATTKKLSGALKQDDYQETYYMQPASEPPKEIALTSEYGDYDLTEQQKTDFDRFWSMYPRKTNKRRSASQWFHDGCHLIADEIIAKLQEQINHDKSFLDGCIPNPHKYIIEQKWRDEVFKGKNGHFDYNDTSWFEEGKRKEEEFGF